MTKQELDQYFKNLEKIEHARSILPNLKIEWETNLDKIDFLALRSYKLFPNLIENQNKKFKVLSIETIEIEDYNIVDLFVHLPEAIKFLDLIDLIESGTKIIPPICHRSMQMINGELSILQDSHCADGGHRIVLSRSIGLSKIPAVVIESLDRFTFSKSEWQFDYDDNNIEAKNINSNKRFVFIMLDWQLEVNPLGDIIIHRD